jgi:hypothetical protein
MHRARRPATYYATYKAHKSTPAFRFITASPDVPTRGAALALTAALRAILLHAFACLPVRGATLYR